MNDKPGGEDGVEWVQDAASKYLSGLLARTCTTSTCSFTLNALYYQRQYSAPPPKIILPINPTAPLCLCVPRPGWISSCLVSDLALDAAHRPGPRGRSVMPPRAPVTGCLLHQHGPLPGAVLLGGYVIPLFTTVQSYHNHKSRFYVSISSLKSFPQVAQRYRLLCSNVLCVERVDGHGPSKTVSLHAFTQACEDASYSCR